VCDKAPPQTKLVSEHHQVACYLYREGELWEPRRPQAA